MLGPIVTILGGLLVIAGLALMLGPFALIGGGVVLVMFGLFVDLDPVKEPQRAKRRPAAP